MIDPYLVAGENAGGTHDQAPKGAILTPEPYPPVESNGADAAQIFRRNLLFYFIEQIRQTNVQRLGKLKAGQKARNSLMSFNIADRGPRNSGQFCQGLMGIPFSLPQFQKLLGQFLNSLFGQFIPHSGNNCEQSSNVIRNSCYPRKNQ